MLINKQEINIDDLFDDKYMHKNIGNDIYLNDYQIQVLMKYKINPYECSSINDLMFRVDDILLDEDAEDLELVEKELSEFNYYTNTDK